MPQVTSPPEASLSRSMSPADERLAVAMQRADSLIQRLGYLLPPAPPSSPPLLPYTQPPVSARSGAAYLLARAPALAEELGLLSPSLGDLDDAVFREPTSARSNDMPSARSAEMPSARSSSAGARAMSTSVPTARLFAAKAEARTVAAGSSMAEAAARRETWRSLLPVTRPLSPPAGSGLAEGVADSAQCPAPVTAQEETPLIAGGARDSPRPAPSPRGSAPSPRAVEPPSPRAVPSLLLPRAEVRALLLAAGGEWGEGPVSSTADGESPRSAARLIADMMRAQRADDGAFGGSQAHSIELPVHLLLELRAAAEARSRRSSARQGSSGAMRQPRSPARTQTSRLSPRSDWKAPTPADVLANTARVKAQGAAAALETVGAPAPPPALAPPLPLQRRSLARRLTGRAHSAHSAMRTTTPESGMVVITSPSLRADAAVRALATSHALVGLRARGWRAAEWSPPAHLRAEHDAALKPPPLSALHAAAVPKVPRHVLPPHPVRWE